MHTQQSAQQFTIEHEDLAPEQPKFGRIGTVPWDTKIFGFPVADYKLGEPHSVYSAEADFRRHFSAWVGKRSVKLVSCFAPAGDLAALPVLARLGFSFIELGMTASLRSLENLDLSSETLPVRRADGSDTQGLLSLVQSAFRAGRYAADPLVPRELSSRRYMWWIEQALSAPTPSERVYVAGKHGEPDAFFHLTVLGDTADLRLAAVRRELQGGALGYRLYRAVLRELKDEGVRRAKGRLSATNTAVLNLYAALGFQFSGAEVVLHWHADDACMTRND